VLRAAVGKFLLTQMAAVAELEAGLISKRTRAALAENKARGGVLGSARPGAYRLSAEGHTTRRGLPWNPVQVARVLERAGT
jgi:DNA invertase Pin-like site-specific DNA recombinase